jgi:sugar-specific transcriptional regulator TrmB
MKEILEKLGLSESEAKVYLALIELGSSLAGDITKKAEINRSNCYDALQRLIEKGLVSYVIRVNRKYFEAEKPDKFLEIIHNEKENLTEKEEEMKKMIPILMSKTGISKIKPRATIYEGKRGVRAIYEEIWNYKEYAVIGSSGKFKETLGQFFKDFQTAIFRKKIKCRLLISESARGSDLIRHTNARFLNKSYMTLISTLIYGNNVAIISWSEHPIGFVLEDKQIADSYRTYFEFMWKIAKR